MMNMALEPRGRGKTKYAYLSETFAEYDRRTNQAIQNVTGQMYQRTIDHLTKDAQWDIVRYEVMHTQGEEEGVRTRVCEECCQHLAIEAWSGVGCG